MSDDTIVLHFVRHGETPYNAERRIQGQMHDVPLSDRGREQAREIADELARIAKPELIISSDLLRAMQTAEIIAERLALPVTPEPALRERHFGIAQGQLYADVAELVQEWWKRHDYRIDGGETNREMYARVAAYLGRLRAGPPARELVLVAHGGTVNMALACLAGIPLDEMEWERLENCAIRTVTVTVAAI